MAVPEPDDGRDDLEAGEISLARGDPFFRAQRAIGLIPARGSGIGRRALFFALLSWVPIVAWAGLTGRVLPDAPGEPLLQHFGVTVRCLLAIPLLVAAEALLHQRTSQLVPYFLDSGIVPEAERARFVAVVKGIARLRDMTVPWIAIAALIAAWTLATPSELIDHEVLWASEQAPEPRLGFGGIWFVYVVRPVYMALIAAWVWRLTLLFLLLRRIAALHLSLVPTHPDRAGGLGFVGKLPSAFGPVAFAISAVVGARWAHDIVYHDVHFTSLRLPAIVLVAGLSLAFLAPLLAFAAPLRVARRRALLDYGALVGRHGRLVRGRWILEKEPADADLLAAPEIGPVADTIPLYEAVVRMRGMPFDRSALLSIALPAALPMLLVAAIEVPVKEVVLKLLKAAL